jgi:exodeoxyribonuclease VII small subunit
LPFRTPSPDILHVDLSDGGTASNAHPLLASRFPLPAFMTFEKSIRRLDEIMAALEGEQVGLDASLKLFEEGIQLLRAASTELDKAETKVQMLIEKSDGGFELREMDL